MLAGLSAAFASTTRPKTHWSRWSGLSANWTYSSVGRIEMTDELRRQLREVEQALMALDGVIAVRREYVALRERVGWRERELAGLEALVDAAAKLRSQRDGLEMRIACRDV
jgi:hypothetical protein